MDREEGKLARKELNNKIKYLEGLDRQKRKEIKEYEKGRKLGETVKPIEPVKEPMPVIEPEQPKEELSASEKANIAYLEERERRRREEED